MVSSPVFTVLATTLAVISMAGAIALDKVRFDSDLPTPLLDSEEGRVAPQLNSSVHQQNLHRRDGTNENGFAAGGGYVRYSGFDNQQRVSWATALINSDTYARNLGSGAAGAIKPSGWNAIGVTGNRRHRCHLIGNQLGGSGKDARNLFTCHAFANSPVMRHYENKVAALVQTFPTTGPLRLDKGVVHTVSLRYNPSSSLYPGWIGLKSDLYMSGRFSHVLQDLSIKMGASSATSEVRFSCAGAFAQNGPPSLGNQITTSAIPC